ncbi:MAG: hypothetical protein K2Q06_04630 [Parvularculaceae bacterium]|nr:hypothetical protein [Parvularculaceae bacterium]
MDKFFRWTVVAAGLSLSGCGPAYAPPDAPARACPSITGDAYEAAKAGGAAWAVARVHNDGSVSMTTGPGIVHCATFTSAMKPCRRPNDFVIRYELADGSREHVMVPKGEDYRFNVRRGPVHCEILER